MIGRDIIWLLGNIVVFAAVPGLVAFVAIYSRSKWRTNEVGRTIMYFMAALAAIVITSILVIFLGDGYFLREWFRLGLLLIVTVSVYRLAGIVYKIQNKTPKTEAELRAQLDALLAREKRYPDNPGHIRMDEGLDKGDNNEEVR